MDFIVNVSVTRSLYQDDCTVTEVLLKRRLYQDDGTVTEVFLKRSLYQDDCTATEVLLSIGKNTRSPKCVSLSLICSLAT